MVKHLFISFCLTLVLSLSVSAQTPSLIWAKQIFGTTIVSAKSITTDKYGNVFTTGEFYGTVDFDPNIGQFMLTSEGSADIYITKFDSAGNFIWAKQLSGLSDQYVETIKLDTLGNIYTSGSFSMTMDFDPGSGIYSLNASGIYDAFISKLDSNGNFI